MSGCRCFEAEQALLDRYQETCLWVAERLLTLAALDPHEWDRAALRDLAEALTSNPRLAPKRADVAQCEACGGRGERFIDYVNCGPILMTCDKCGGTGRCRIPTG